MDGRKKGRPERDIEVNVLALHKTRGKRERKEEESAGVERRVANFHIRVDKSLVKRGGGSH